MDMGLPTEGGLRPTEKRVGVQRSPPLYNTEKETLVSADSSSYGLGAIIRQRQKDGTESVKLKVSSLMALILEVRL